MSLLTGGSLLGAILLSGLGLFSPPYIHPAPAHKGSNDPGPVVPLDASLAKGQWTARHLGTNPASSFHVRPVYRGQGRKQLGVVLLREKVHGINVAGSRLALRVDLKGRLMGVVGKSLAPDAALPLAPDPASLPPRAIWWPVNGMLQLARVETTSLRFVDGQPEQFDRVLSVVDGWELSRWSTIDHGPVSVRGWPENPLTTPITQVYSIELDDQNPVRLENQFLRVWDCAWDEVEETCSMVFSPTADPAVGFTEPLPPLSLTSVHQDPGDDFAGPQFTQWGMRFYDRLLSWGWDPYVWDLLDCSWQGVEPDDCRVFGRVNVMRQDEEGVFPFSGAFYSTGSGIWMGQGVNSDTAYDGDIVVHEFGHHVTRGYGVPEKTEMERDRSRRYVDRSSINEGTSDLFARQLGLNDRIYDYYAAVEPSIYNDNRIRDVGIPFRCPENLVGETHMDGRIWVSTLREAQVVLHNQDLVTEDEFMESFLVAHAAIRQIPREDLEQLDDAAQLFLDELLLSRGTQAEAVARAIFEDRGLLTCRRTRDLRQDPHVRGDFDPDDPLDDRFLVFSSHSAAAPADQVDNYPYAPAIHHEVELADDEGSITLRARPGLWRPARPDEELPSFRLGMLVSQSESEIAFWFDEEAGWVNNDAQMRFETTERDAEGYAEITAEGLVPGTHYAIALVTLEGLSGDRLVLEDMQWSLNPVDNGGESSGSEGETGSDGETGSESATGSGVETESGDSGAETDGSSGETGTGTGNTGHGNDGRLDGEDTTVSTGCACASDDAPAPAGMAFALLGLLGLRRRR